MTIDNRRNPRVPLDVDVVISYGEGATEGRARDISLGGMFVTAATQPPFGASVTLRFRMPTHDGEVSLPGVVRWTRDDGVGIQFGTFGAKETFAITEWVRRANG